MDTHPRGSRQEGLRFTQDRWNAREKIFFWYGKTSLAIMKAIGWIPSVDAFFPEKQGM